MNTEEFVDKYYIMPSEYYKYQHFVNLREAYSVDEAMKIFDEKITNSIILATIFGEIDVSGKSEFLKNIREYIWNTLNKDITFNTKGYTIAFVDEFEEMINDAQDIFEIKITNDTMKLTFHNEDDARKFIKPYRDYIKEGLE